MSIKAGASPENAVEFTHQQPNRESMIKVLKRYPPKGSEPVEHTCTNCKSELQLVPRIDAEFHSDQRDGDYWKFTCPVCNHTQYI